MTVNVGFKVCFLSGRLSGGPLQPVLQHSNWRREWHHCRALRGFVDQGQVRAGDLMWVLCLFYSSQAWRITRVRLKSNPRPTRDSRFYPTASFPPYFHARNNPRSLDVMGVAEPGHFFALRSEGVSPLLRGVRVLVLGCACGARARCGAVV